MYPARPTRRRCRPRGLGFLHLVRRKRRTPTGLNLSPTGVISGTTVASVISTVSVMASDNNAAVQAISTPLSVAPAATPLSIVSSSLRPRKRSGLFTGSCGDRRNPRVQLAAHLRQPARGIDAQLVGRHLRHAWLSGTFPFTVSVNDNGAPSQSQSASLSLNVSSRLRPAHSTPGTSAPPVARAIR